MADQFVQFVLRTGVGIINSKDTLLCVAHDGPALRFDGESAGFAAAALEILASPSSASDLTAELARRADAEVDPAIVEDLLRALQRARLVVTHNPERQQPPQNNQKSLHGARIVLALTGAIAAAEAPRTVLALQRRGATVRVAMSRAAKRFVSHWTLQALTHEKVFTRMVSRDPHTPAPHIELGRWADAVLVAPTSATTLSRIAGGDNSDLVAALCIASPAPVLLAPSMNVRMLRAPSTQRNLEVLRSDGFHVLAPSSGVEVADEPEGRKQMAGVTLTAEALVHAFDAWYQQIARAQTTNPEVLWDEVYKKTAAADLPWIADGLDESLRAQLLALAPPPGSALDIGCGLGFQSRGLAALGYLTVGVDLSKEAIQRAATLAPQKGFLFVHDDFLASKLNSHFDVVLDRGTFHTLPASSRASYMKSIGRLTGPGSIFVVFHDSKEADGRFATMRMSPEELESVFNGFERITSFPVTLRRAEDGKAFCTVLRRVG